MPHSHDSSDKIDSALEASQEGMRCLKLSFGFLMLTALIQTVIVFYTNSVALLGDTLHNYADALTAVPLAIAFLVGRRMATRAYTYGYGRAEDLAGIVVVVLIAASAAYAGYEAIKRFMNPGEVRHLGVLAVAGVVGFLGNEIVAKYRIRTGRRIGSAALVADGLHARTDGFTSLAVVLSAPAAPGSGYPIADPIIGLLITVAILYVLRDAAREVYRRLMDAVDPAPGRPDRAGHPGHPGRGRRHRRPAALARAQPARRGPDHRRHRPCHWSTPTTSATASSTTSSTAYDASPRPTSTPSRWPRTPPPHTTRSATTTDQARPGAPTPTRQEQDTA